MLNRRSFLGQVIGRVPFVARLPREEVPLKLKIPEFRLLIKEDISKYVIHGAPIIDIQTPEVGKWIFKAAPIDMTSYGRYYLMNREGKVLRQLKFNWELNVVSGDQLRVTIPIEMPFATNTDFEWNLNRLAY